MHHRQHKRLAALGLAALMLLTQAPALAAGVYRGDSVAVSLPFSSAEAFTSLRVVFTPSTGLTFTGAGATGMSHAGGGNFTAGAPMSSGTVTLRFTVDMDAAATEYVDYEGAYAALSTGSQSVGISSKQFSFTIMDDPAPTPTATPTPTAVPTATLTATPEVTSTTALTEEPTVEPTSTTTLVLTEAPTEAPTDTPTEVPTDAPIEAVTEAPAEVWPETWETTTPATCAQPGLRSRTSNLGNTQTEEIPIDPDAHAYGEWQLIYRPTLIETGLLERVCAHDANHIDSEIRPVLAPNWGPWQIVSQATCEQSGLMVREHLDNNEVRETQVIPLEPGAHDWGEWIVLQKPTLYSSGLRERYCAHNPAHFESEVLPVLMPAWSPWQVVREAGCEVPGLLQRVHLVDPDITESEEIPATGHAWGEWQETLRPTVAAPGRLERVCLNDPSHIESDAIPALPPDWAEWEIIEAPDCERPGLRQRVHLLDPELVESEEIPALGHAWGEWLTLEKPTLMAPGQRERVCLHDPAHVERETLPVLPEEWEEWTELKPATCTLPGERQRQHLLDEELIQTEEIPALGHDWGDWEVIRHATCTQPGREERVCLRDPSHIIWGELPLKPHQESADWQTMVAPSYTRGGIRAKVCEVGGEWLTSEMTPPLPPPQGPVTISTGPRAADGGIDWMAPVRLDLSQEGQQRVALYDSARVHAGYLAVTVAGDLATLSEQLPEGFQRVSQFVALYPAKLSPDSEPGLLQRYQRPLDQPFSLQEAFGDERQVMLNTQSVIRIAPETK